MLKGANEIFDKFLRRMDQLALMADTLKVEKILGLEYGIQLSMDEIGALQKRGPKWFLFGVIELWSAKQPQAALSWAASISWPNMFGVNLLQLFLDAARKTLPDMNRDTLGGMLPEGPGKAYALDLAEAATDPYSLASRILAVTNPTERASRLKALAQGWPDHVTAAEWARQNLSGAEKTAFYSQVGYWLAEQNPDAAFRVLAEIKIEPIDVKSYCIDPKAAAQIMAELNFPGTYAFTLGTMMRGLVQECGCGQQVAELIAGSGLSPRQRGRLISELSRRWVRQDADAAVAWASALTEPEDIRAAIPLLISQLDSDRVSRAVEAYLECPDPVMELALIEAAAPDLNFDPRKSRMILDPIISKDPGLKLQSSKDDGNDGQSDMRERIARRAHEIYEERGSSDGEDMNDWLKAEAEVKSSIMAERRRAIEGRWANKQEALWNSVRLTAKRIAEVDRPAAAMEWLDTLPFVSQSDFAMAAGAALTVWYLKSPAEAAEWLQNSTLSPKLKSGLQKIVEQ